MSEYVENTIRLAQREYYAAGEQRKKDIKIPHPITGAEITEPWFYYERMYRGYHYDFITRMATWASMPVANKIFAGIEAYATMLCDAKPAITLVAREPSDERVTNIAKAGLSYWWDSAGMENTISVTVKASRIFGIGWFHTYWDKEKDTVICETVHPSHILVDQNCVAGNFDPEALIYEYKAQYGSLKSKYNGNKLPDGTKVDFGLFARDKNWTLDVYNPDQPDERWKDQLTPSTSVNVYEFWYKDPSKHIWEDEDESGLIVEKSKKNYPRGRVITIAGGMILDDRENPHFHGEFPFTPLHAYIVPGRFYGIGDVQMVMNTQIMRNRFAQLVIDMTMKAGGGWMFLGSGSKVKPSQISQGPFNIVPCGDVNQIKIDRPPSPPRHVFDFINVLDMDFDDAMGIHEISRGATLTSHKTAQEISVMAESDRTRVRQAARNLIWSLKRVARQVMWDLAQYHKGDWFVRIAGDPNDIVPLVDEDGNVYEGENRYEEFDFNGKMLLDNDGEALKYDIVFADDATLPNSQSETFAKIQGLLEMGIIMPEDVLKYRLVDIPYAEQIYMDRKEAMEQEQAAAESQAQAPVPGEMAAMAAGMPAPGAIPPEAMGGAMPPGAMAPPIPGMPPELANMPPDLLMQLMGGTPPMAAPGPMGDPVTDMLMAQQGGMPQGGMPPDIDPNLLAQLAGGAAVPTSPPPGVDPLAGLGSTPMPMGGPDMGLMQGMMPPAEQLTTEQIQLIAQQLSDKYGLPIQLILDLLFELAGIIQEEESFPQEEMAPQDMGGYMPEEGEMGAI